MKVSLKIELSIYTLYFILYSEQVEAKWGMMADIKFIPYKQDLIKSDYIINTEIEAFDLEGEPISPICISKTFTLGSWAILQVVPIL